MRTYFLFLLFSIQGFELGLYWKFFEIYQKNNGIFRLQKYIELANNEGLNIPEDEIKIHIASNQSGVAIGYFSEGRAREITEYIMKITREAGGRIDGYELSFHVPLFGYVIRRALEGRLSLSNVDWKYVKLRTPRRKPDIGMMKNVVEADGNKIGNSVIYMIGDLKQDIEMGINAGGKSVLVLNGSNDKEKGKVEKLMNKPKLKGRIQIVENFLEAAKWILDDLYS